MRYALQVAVDGGFIGREFDPETEIIDAFGEAVRQYHWDPDNPPDVVTLVLIVREDDEHEIDSA